MKRLRYALAVLLALSSPILAQTPVITEFSADPTGKSTFVDEDQDSSDWIEIQNPTDAEMDLAGMWLTDNATNLKKWAFPAPTTIPAGGYLVVFASGKNRAVSGKPLHASFQLNTDSGDLLLVAADGTTVLSSFAQYPAQKSDVSYGRLGPDAKAYFVTSTPGAANGSGFVDFVRDTNFSVSRGFKDEPFPLEIISKTPGATIRFTTDGSWPATSSTATDYVGPLTIDKTTVVRAYAFKDGLIPTNTDTHTYLFLNDIITQNSNGDKLAGWPSASSYGMDPDITSKYSAEEMKNAFRAATTCALSLKVEDFAFVSDNGGYGEAFERATSLEMLDPKDPKNNIQIDAGLRQRGGASRGSRSPKHGYRLYFSSQYSGRLRYKWFGDEGVGKFAKMDLRTAQNYAWGREGNINHTEIREVFSRDCQRDMGQPYTRSRYHHLFINGVYWGVYQSQERAESYYGATYFGGSDADYDTIKSAGAANRYDTEATDGDVNGDWKMLWDLQREQFASPTVERYMRMQGLDPDGTRNPAYPVLLDVDNTIDYTLVYFYTGDRDGPIGFPGASNNWFAVRNRVTDDRGFAFFRHDAEHSLGLPNSASENRVAAVVAGRENFRKSNPDFVHRDLETTDDYRVRFMDRVYLHFFNGGALAPERNRQRILSRKAELEPMIIAEAARWGDHRRAAPLDKPDWENAVANLLNNVIPTRDTVVLEQLRTANLFVAPPEFSQRGGVVQPGTEISVSGSNVIYTTDGSDPRLLGGGVNPTAKSVVDGKIRIESSGKIRLRGQSPWTALNQATFIVGAPASASNLVISKIHYHPSDPTAEELAALPGVTDNSFEFLELLNASEAPIDLTGASFSNGLTLAFANGVTLAGGARGLIVANRAAFEKRYAALLPLNILGEFQNGSSLDNGGEKLALVDVNGAPIAQFSYDDKEPWPLAADGQGVSLVLKNAAAKPDATQAANWIASAAGGAPGQADTVVIDPPPPPPPTGFTGDALADNDGDGVKAIVEYVLGSSDSAPNDAQPLVLGSATLVDGVFVTLSVVRVTDRKDVSITPERSVDLSAWLADEQEFVSLGSEDLGDGKTRISWRSAKPISELAGQFFRLKMAKR